MKTLIVAVSVLVDVQVMLFGPQSKRSFTPLSMSIDAAENANYIIWLNHDAKSKITTLQPPAVAIAWPELQLYKQKSSTIND